MLHVTNSYFVLFVVVILPFSLHFHIILLSVFFWCFLSIVAQISMNWYKNASDFEVKIWMSILRNHCIPGATSLTNRYSTLSHHDSIIKKVRQKYEKVLELARSNGRRKRRKRRTKRAAAAQTCKKFMDLMDECKLFFSLFLSVSIKAL